jgi:hypothetical protein
MFFRVLSAMMAADAVDRHLREQQARRLNELYRSPTADSRSRRPGDSVNARGRSAGQHESSKRLS